MNQQARELIHVYLPEFSQLHECSNVFVARETEAFKFTQFGVWAITSWCSCEELLRLFGCEFWVAPWGLLGTADVCPELLPYQDPSARHFATLLTLSCPVFLSQSATQSISFCLSFSLIFCILAEAESKHSWPDGFLFISDRLGLVAVLWFERASLLTILLCSYLGSGF